MTESTPSFLKFQSISLFIGIWAVLLGIWTLSYIYQMYKRYKKNILKWYLIYIFLMNFSIIVFQIIAYLYVIKSDTSFMLLLYRYAFAVIINSLTVVVSIYYLIKVLTELNNLKCPVYIKPLFFIVMIIFISNYFIGLYLFLQFKAGYWLKITDLVVDIFSWLAIFVVLIYFSLIAPKDKTQIYRKASLTFFYFYITFYIIWSLSVLPSEPIRYYTVFFTYIIFNVIPLIWIPTYYMKSLNIQKQEDEMGPSDSFIKEFHITKREKEIINLIINGKSNKEIADILFISLSTVRNHIYRLYQKLKVNSRIQMINKILEEKN